MPWNPQTNRWESDNNFFGGDASTDMSSAVWNPKADGFDWSELGNNKPVEGFGFNNSTLSAGGSVLSGLGSLANAWAGLQGVKLGKQQLGVQQDQWNKNYDSQATTINNRIADQNAWKAAQGRTDLGSLVPKYNVG
jgi:hypothetical protein